jgi:hypothetical protein
MNGESRYTEVRTIRPSSNTAPFETAQTLELRLSHERQAYRFRLRLIPTRLKNFAAATLFSNTRILLFRYSNGNARKSGKR